MKNSQEVAHSYNVVGKESATLLLFYSYFKNVA